MGRQRYTKEFKTELVAAYRAQSQSCTAFAKANNVSPKTLSDWVAQDFSSRPVTEQDSIRRIAELERENRELRMERDILKKATAFFAKESR